MLLSSWSELLFRRIVTVITIIITIDIIIAVVVVIIIAVSIINGGMNLKWSEAQCTRAESTHKGVN